MPARKNGIGTRESDFTADGEGVLYLEGQGGAHATVDGTELANLLADQTSLRLVVLRLGRSPLPDDHRTCVFLEQSVRSDVREPALVG